jgi:hypothetical protein
MSSPEDTVNVRFMVDDGQAAIDFHARHLGFNVVGPFEPAASSAAG